MLYWKVSPYRTFFLNEYWIFIPVMILVDYEIIRRVRKKRIRDKKLKELKESIKRLKHNQKKALITAFALSYFIIGAKVLQIRGGSDLIIDLGQNECGLEKGLRYVNNNRIRKLVESLFSEKQKNGVIFITATALCRLVKKYGMHFIALPIAINDFGMTNYYQTIRKGLVTLLMGAPVPLVYVYFSNPYIMVLAVIIWVSGLKLGSINLDYIPTTLVDPNIPIELIQPRIPDLVDVVSVNLTPRYEETRKPECWLADQVLTNPNCRMKPTQIPDAIVQSSINYDDVVNMEDLTDLHLENVKFSDINEVGKIVDSTSSPKPSLRPHKMVNFLDKFRDPPNLDESTSWDLDANNFDKKPVIDVIVEDFE